MQNTPKANRPHIAVFGRRNAGKSSLINALSNQELAVVSDVPGTTTDPVYKSMEFLPLGPVVLIDTAGIDDKGKLGQLRVKKTREIVRKTDLALILIDPGTGIDDYERNLIKDLKRKKTKYLIVVNKFDIYKKESKVLLDDLQNEFNIDSEIITVSALKNEGIDKLREKIIDKIPDDHEKPSIIGDLIKPGDTVVLVTPIDDAAPKRRLILPQVQTIRDILDHDAVAYVTKENELKSVLDNLKENPAMVVTDSQAFMKVEPLVPDDILLTGFSILFARYKGDLKSYIEGIIQLEKLKPGDKVLVAEACTHHRQEDDIATVKLPRWMQEKTGNLEFDHVAGYEYPNNLSDYDLVLHCGACMLNRQEVLNRLEEARSEGVPVLNYGMAIAALHGILNRALKPFPALYQEWKKAVSE